MEEDIDEDGPVRRVVVHRPNDERKLIDSAATLSDI
jgi:hypothetical protein